MALAHAAMDAASCGMNEAAMSVNTQRYLAAVCRVLCVELQVLDARDPLGTRCRYLEHHLKKNATHKHMLLLLNKCDLVRLLIVSLLYTRGNSLRTG